MFLTKLNLVMVMYVLLIYDIIADKGGAKVTRNMFKICKRY